MTKSIFLKMAIFILIFFEEESSFSSVNPESELPGPIEVVVSFSILADLVHQLGGSHVNVLSLVPADSDAHIYSPRPSDIGRLAHAELVIINGLHFEGWITRLIDSAGFEEPVIVATTGITPRFSKGVVDPHAWQSIVHIRRYVDNITDAFIDYRPEYRSDFIQNRDRFLSEVNQLEQSIDQRLLSIPKSKRKVVTSHDAFGYLGEQFDIEFLAPISLGTDADVRASDVVNLINQIKEHQISAVFVENIADPRLLQQIGRETGIKLGGRLYSDALSSPEGPANTYLKMMQHNLDLITEALSIK